MKRYSADGDLLILNTLLWFAYDTVEKKNPLTEKTKNKSSNLEFRKKNYWPNWAWKLPISQLAQLLESNLYREDYYCIEIIYTLKK